MLKKYDLTILIIYLFLSIFGVLMIFSASSYRLMVQEDSIYTLLIKQSLIMFFSWSIVFFISRVKLPILLSKLWMVMFMTIGIVLLILIYIPSFGVTIGGSQRWVSIWGMQLQPGEVINVAIIFFMAYLGDHHFFGKYKKISFWLILTICLLLLLQPKITGVIIVLILAVVMLTSNTLHYKASMLVYIVTIISVLLVKKIILAVSTFSIFPTSFTYILDRLILSSNPFEDPYNKGFQMTQSYFALYNGGFFGRGLGNSITKRGFLPVAETDFIFSVIVEELGLITALIILFLLFVLICRLFILSTKAVNTQESLVLMGTGLLILVQTSVNIASITGLIPMTGIPLPFLSYGGSNYLFLSITIGVCLKISGKVRIGKYERKTV